GPWPGDRKRRRSHQAVPAIAITTADTIVAISQAGAVVSLGVGARARAGSAGTEGVAPRGGGSGGPAGAPGRGRGGAPGGGPRGRRQGPGEALVAWQRIDHRAAGGARVQVLADLPGRLAWPGADAGHRVGEGVLRSEGGRRWRRGQRGRFVRRVGTWAEQHRE